jgi:CpeT protein
MKRFKLISASLVVLMLCLMSCAHHPAPVSKNDKQISDLERLADWMTGSFSSEKQAKSDDEYRDIRLHMVRIWKGRVDGYWLYIEQAVAGKPPYRQRVYHVEQLTPEIYRSSVYTFKNAESFMNGWQKPESFDAVPQTDLEAREGCEIILKKKGNDAFVGNTIGKECPSDLHGAAYATSEAVINKNKMTSWDRGFDKDGKQIWGAEKGGYVFEKLEDYPL